MTNLPSRPQLVAGFVLFCLKSWIFSIRFKLDFGNTKLSSIRTLFLADLTISIMMKNRQLFSLDENVSLSKHSMAQVQASPSSSDTSFDNTALPIQSCQFQNYLFHAQDFLKAGKVIDNIQFPTESSRVRKVLLISED